MSPQNNEVFFVSLIIFTIGIYLIVNGLLALSKSKTSLPIFRHLETFLYDMLYGKGKLSEFEKEMANNPKKMFRNGIIWVLSGLFFIMAGLFVIYVE